MGSFCSSSGSGEARDGTDAEIEMLRVKIERQQMLKRKRQQMQQMQQTTVSEQKTELKKKMAPLMMIETHASSSRTVSSMKGIHKDRSKATKGKQIKGEESEDFKLRSRLNQSKLKPDKKSAHVVKDELEEDLESESGAEESEMQLKKNQPNQESGEQTDTVSETEIGSKTGFQAIVIKTPEEGRRRKTGHRKDKKTKKDKKDKKNKKDSGDGTKREKNECINLDSQNVIVLEKNKGSVENYKVPKRLAIPPLDNPNSDLYGRHNLKYQNELLIIKDLCDQDAMAKQTPMKADSNDLQDAPLETAITSSTRVSEVIKFQDVAKNNGKVNDEAPFAKQPPQVLNANNIHSNEKLISITQRSPTDVNKNYQRQQLFVKQPKLSPIQKDSLAPESVPVASAKNVEPIQKKLVLPKMRKTTPKMKAAMDKEAIVKIIRSLQKTLRILSNTHIVLEKEAVRPPMNIKADKEISPNKAQITSANLAPMDPSNGPSCGQFPYPNRSQNSGQMLAFTTQSTARSSNVTKVNDQNQVLNDTPTDIQTIGVTVPASQPQPVAPSRNPQTNQYPAQTPTAVHAGYYEEMYSNSPTIKNDIGAVKPGTRKVNESVKYKEILKKHSKMKQKGLALHSKAFAPYPQIHRSDIIHPSKKGIYTTQSFPQNVESSGKKLPFTTKNSLAPESVTPIKTISQKMVPVRLPQQHKTTPKVMPKAGKDSAVKIMRSLQKTPRISSNPHADLEKETVYPSLRNKIDYEMNADKTPKSKLSISHTHSSGHYATSNYSQNSGQGSTFDTISKPGSSTATVSRVRNKNQVPNVDTSTKAQRLTTAQSERIVPSMNPQPNQYVAATPVQAMIRAPVQTAPQRPVQTFGQTPVQTMNQTPVQTMNQTPVQTVVGSPAHNDVYSKYYEQVSSNSPTTKNNRSGEENVVVTVVVHKDAQGKMYEKEIITDIPDSYTSDSGFGIARMTSDQSNKSVPSLIQESTPKTISEEIDKNDDSIKANKKRKKVRMEKG